MPNRPQSPKKLDAAGRSVWKWAIEHYDVAGVEPMLAELCELSDRLEAVRVTLRGQSKPDPRMIAAEVKLTGQFQRAWKLLGLADQAPEEKRRPGRPAGVPLRRVS